MTAYPKMKAWIAIALYCSVSVLGLDTLVVNIRAPPNPFGRPIRICGQPEVGFMLQNDRDKFLTFNNSVTVPEIFSATKGNIAEIKGFDVDFVKEVFRTLSWEYEHHVYASYSSAIYNTRRGNCDFAFGAFNQYESRTQCDATPAYGQSWNDVSVGCPYYLNPRNSNTTDSMWTAGCCVVPLAKHLINGLAVMAEVPYTSSTQRMINVVTGGFVMNWIIWLVGGILVFGHVMWFLERDKDAVDGVDNPQFPRSLVQGGQEGVWWALVTTTTVGYGDISIKQGFSRLLTAVWMAAGFIALACIIGSITAGLSEPTAETQILSTDGLKSKRVCTYTSYVSKITQFGPIVKPAQGYENINDCFIMLKEGTIDAVVYDHGILKGARMDDAEMMKFTVGEQFEEMQQGAYCVMGQETFTRNLNWAIGSVVDDNIRFKKIYEAWMGGGTDGGGGSGEAVNSGQAIALIFFWGVYLILQIISAHTPWTNWVRLKLGSGAVAEFIFGTEEERANFKKKAGHNDSKWEVLPSCMYPKSGIVAPEPEQSEVKYPPRSALRAVFANAMMKGGEANRGEPSQANGSDNLQPLETIDAQPQDDQKGTPSLTGQVYSFGHRHSDHDTPTEVID